MVVKDVGSSQGEFVTQVAGTGGQNFSRNPRDVPVEKLQRSVEEVRLENPETVRIEIACVAADLCVQSSVVCRDFIKAGGKRPITGERAAVAADEADDYVDVVGSNIPVHSHMECEGFTFRESLSHCFLKVSGGVLDISGLCLLFKFYKSHLHSDLAFFDRLYILGIM